MSLTVLDPNTLCLPVCPSRSRKNPFRQTASNDGSGFGGPEAGAFGGFDPLMLGGALQQQQQLSGAGTLDGDELSGGEAGAASRRSGRRRAAKALGEEWCEPGEVRVSSWGGGGRGRGLV